MIFTPYSISVQGDSCGQIPLSSNSRGLLARGTPTIEVNPTQPGIQPAESPCTHLLRQPPCLWGTPSLCRVDVIKVSVPKARRGHRRPEVVRLSQREGGRGWRRHDQVRGGPDAVVGGRREGADADAVHRHQGGAPQRQVQLAQVGGGVRKVNKAYSSCLFGLLYPHVKPHTGEGSHTYSWTMGRTNARSPSCPTVSPSRIRETGSSAPEKRARQGPSAGWSSLGSQLSICERMTYFVASMTWTRGCTSSGGRTATRSSSPASIRRASS